MTEPSDLRAAVQLMNDLDGQIGFGLPASPRGVQSGRLVPKARRDVYEQAESVVSPAFAGRRVAGIIAESTRFPLPVSADATTLDAWPARSDRPSMAEAHRRLDDGLRRRGIDRGKPRP